jgi:hypothetical protein
MNGVTAGFNIGTVSALYLSAAGLAGGSYYYDLLNKPLQETKLDLLGEQKIISWFAGAIKDEIEIRETLEHNIKALYPQLTACYTKLVMAAPSDQNAEDLQKVSTGFTQAIMDFNREHTKTKEHNTGSALVEKKGSVFSWQATKSIDTNAKEIYDRLSVSFLQKESKSQCEEDICGVKQALESLGNEATEIVTKIVNNIHDDYDC